MTKLLILAAGIGSRMENPNINKGLLPISGKAIITHIIENVNADHIVIAVGYKFQQIKDYCNCVHSKENITFVDIENFDGPGSGPGTSMYCCKELLNEPFYIVTADSLLINKLPEIDVDWIGVSEVPDLENYATCEIDDKNKLVDFKNKDKNNSHKLAFTGVLAVKNTEKFWARFDEYKKINPDKEVELVGALYKPFYEDIYAKNIGWFDIGRKSLYKELHLNTKSFAAYDLKKINVEEYLYKYDNKILKIASEEKIKRKKERAILLKGLVPDLKNEELKNVFSYSYIEGKTLYEYDDIEIYKEFLNWCNSNLFNRSSEHNVDDRCMSFYKNKTLKRIETYQKQNDITSEDNLVINGDKCKGVLACLESIDWDLLCRGNIPYAFHGDLNFGNCIYDKNKNFTLIDWRDDFDGAANGDLYYDLAKLYAGSILNLFEISNRDINITKIGNSIKFDNYTTDSTDQFKIFYESWIADMKYDLDKIKVLSSLIFLNMSPLHPDKFGKYLYYFGLLNLNTYIRNGKN